MKSLFFISAVILGIGGGALAGFTWSCSKVEDKVLALQKDVRQYEIDSATCRMRLEQFADEWLIPRHEIPQGEPISI